MVAAILAQENARVLKDGLVRLANFYVPLANMVSTVLCDAIAKMEQIVTALLESVNVCLDQLEKDANAPVQPVILVQDVKKYANVRMVQSVMHPAVVRIKNHVIISRESVSVPKDIQDMDALKYANYVQMDFSEKVVLKNVSVVRTLTVIQSVGSATVKLVTVEWNVKQFVKTLSSYVIFENIHKISLDVIECAYVKTEGHAIDSLVNVNVLQDSLDLHAIKYVPKDGGGQDVKKSVAVRMELIVMARQEPANVAWDIWVLHASKPVLQANTVQIVLSTVNVMGMDVCPIGFYGWYCSQSCDCQNGASCEPGDGQCLCRPGFEGDRCELACKNNTFGPHCQLKCDCGEFPCDPTDVCRPGRYGENCAHKCQCYNGATCDRKTGKCGCAPGYLGPTCQAEMKGLTYCKEEIRNNNSII
uniref:EGF-like domain-containing protein n=1 Tax=Heterorhabditis bacteriophora TaxID=37862 RepID=A0A1I7XTN8_HETBA